MPDSWERPRAFYEVNVLGTANVLEFCRRHEVPLTFVSSYVYGIPRSLPIRRRPSAAAVESVQPQQDSGGRHRSLLRRSSASARRSSGHSTSMARARTRASSSRRSSARRSIRLPTGSRCAICGRGATHPRPRSRVAADRDVEPSRRRRLQRRQRQSAAFRSWSQAIDAALAAPKPLHSIDDVRHDEVLDVVADMTRAKAELGWQPRIGLAEGLRDTIRWMQAQPVESR